MRGMVRSMRLFGFVMLAGLIAFSMTPAQTKTEKKTDPKDVKKADPKKADPKKVEPKETTKEPTKEPTKKSTGATFELYTDTGGSFRYRLVDNDTKAKLGMSVRGYDTKEECLKMIEGVKELAAKAKIDDQSKETTEKTEPKEKTKK